MGNYRLLNFLDRLFFFFCPYLNLLQYCFWLFVLVFCPQEMWDLSSLTRDQTLTLCIGRQSLNHRTTREVPPGPVLPQHPITLNIY